jgi:nickel superoxide dismutase
MALTLLLTVLSVNSVCAHCEIPCGIYDDEMRFDMITEHIATIEKSMKTIIELSQSHDQNYNQLMRWVMNKEEHAHHIQEIVYQYFLTQRVKPINKENGSAYENYVKQLTLLHEMLVSAMKAKQTTDITHVERLRNLLEEFRTVYFGD